MLNKGAWSVLYLCPPKALLNNLLSRPETYTSWLGRTAALWHGDASQTRRKRIPRERPDVLLTTPESLEDMLERVAGRPARRVGDGPTAPSVRSGRRGPSWSTRTRP
ncbi:DEAD/DEAH box helicase [Streptomyces sp. NPDC048680]|uniref:DEAD/DEAH box helicase n=1 Tax=Streptomyces sp. NPDC048680 TaxID=3155492 RepID=UPI00343E28FA